MIATLKMQVSQNGLKVNVTKYFSIKYHQPPQSGVFFVCGMMCIFGNDIGRYAMSKIGKTFIVLLISFVVWFGVAFITKGYGLGEPEGPIVLFLVPIIISIFYYAYAEETKVIKKHKTLSEKYVVLEIYKVLAFLLMIAATGFFIYSLVQYIEAPKAARKILENAIITSTVSYFITMFSLFCLTKMIDFLFELDKNKSDK